MAYYKNKLANVGLQWGVLYSCYQNFPIFLKAVVANTIAKPYKLLCFYLSAERLQKAAKDFIMWSSFASYGSDGWSYIWHHFLFFLIIIIYLFCQLVGWVVLVSNLWQRNSKSSLPSSSTPGCLVQHLLNKTHSYQESGCILTMLHWLWTGCYWLCGRTCLRCAKSAFPILLCSLHARVLKSHFQLQCKTPLTLLVRMQTLYNNCPVVSGIKIYMGTSSSPIQLCSPLLHLKRQ